MENSSTFSLFGEHSLTLIGAEFSNSAAAQAAAEDLNSDPSLTGQIAVLAPKDPLVGMKLEPEQRGIWLTLIRSHVILGTSGMLLGVLLAGLLVLSGWPPAATSPALTSIFLAMMFGFLGMMIAGLITLRPDHEFVIRHIRDALKHHKWAVVVRPLNEHLAQLAIDVLQRHGAKPVRSI